MATPRPQPRPLGEPAERQATLTDPWLDELSSAIWAKPEFSMVPIDYEAVPDHPYQGVPLASDGLRIVFVGIPSDYGTSFLLHLLSRRANLVAVVCSTRWQRTHPKADLLARIAGYLGRPVEVVADVNAPAFVSCLQRYRPDVVVMASFDQILHAEPLAVPRLGWVNVHPSLLPRHRGPEPLYWTILQGDRQAGITLHWTVARIDAGPILAQRRLPVRRDDTAGSLCKRLVAAGVLALDETLDRLAAGPIAGSLVAVEAGSYEPPVRQAELDWDQESEHLVRLVRAGRPDQPPSFLRDGERRFVIQVRRVRPRRGERPGVLADLGDGESLAVTHDAVVRIGWRRFGHEHALRPLRKQQFP